jgi:hypothetical protein
MGGPINCTKAKWIYMRTGAFSKFDIDEAIKTSDRRKAEKAQKNTVPDEEELGA